MPLLEQSKGVEPNIPTTSGYKKVIKTIEGFILYNVLSHLKKIPLLLSVSDALKMSSKLKRSLIYALMNPEDFTEME